MDRLVHTDFDLLCCLVVARGFGGNHCTVNYDFGIKDLQIEQVQDD